MAREDDLLKYYTVPPEAALTSVPATEEQKRKVAELNQRVKENVERIQNSAEFRNFLIAMSRFHDYSWNNQMLIWLQKPDATHVAGYRTWADLGRQVRAGEKGIAILAPLGPASATTWTRVTDNAIYAIKRSDKGWAIYDDKETVVEDGISSYSAAARKIKEIGFVEHKEILSVHNFTAVYVFDMSQTTGKPLPEFDVPTLTGEANPMLFEDLLNLAKEQNVTVSFDPPDPFRARDPAIKGYYLPPSYIWVRPEEAPAQQLKTLLHEFSHHYTATVFGIPRADAETIAESSAYIIGAHYGFDSGVRSFPYIALWAKDKNILYANMKSVQEVAEKIIDSLEKRKARLMPMTSSIRPTSVPGDIMKLEVTPSVLEEWQMAEIASWEGARQPKEGHVYNILSRHKSLIEVRSSKEAALLIKSAYYQGDTTGLDPSLVSKRKAIGRIEGKLIEKYGFYYSYPSFRSSKTGEVIPDPIEAAELNKEHDRQRMEATYSLEQIKQMARDRGLPTTGSKREIIERIIK